MERYISITKIVITGGPCGGKSSALRHIREAFEPLGYCVLTVPETASELIGGGVAPWTCGTNTAYQICQMKLQLYKERIFDEAARSMVGTDGQKILIVCDRGAMDNKAYIEDAFDEVLLAVGESEESLLRRYDAVFHLVTAAKGAETFYTKANNAARTEPPEEAAALDDKVLSAWKGHPYLRVVDNSTDFDGKLARLNQEIRTFLAGAIK